MCGIAGFAGPGSRTDIRAMVAALAHRGPDGEGFHHDEATRLFLGHRRLAILDIAGGAQPMWNAQNTTAVVFNGEIYNHRELRRELETLGCRFHTDHSDTEVLVHGYDRWGEDLPRRLNGMFAFCIFDTLRKRLFMARDRLGEKPLYYARSGGLFAFASELTAITSHSHFHARLNRRSAQKYFAYGYVPAPNAILDDCHKLPGGGALRFDLISGEMSSWRYWQFRIQSDTSWERRPEQELAEEFREKLFTAVKRRLISDVPLGFFLSGGIDSTAVLAGAAQALPASQLKSFTIGFTEPSYDESAYALIAAKAFGSEQGIDWLDLGQAREEVPQILSRLDEPLADPSILPTYLLSRFTRKKVTVALSGDGGDEMLAGYDPFAALAPARLYRSFMPRPLHKLLREAAHRLPHSTSNMSLDFKLRRTLTGLSYDPGLWNPVWLAPADPALLVDLMEEPLTPEELYSEALEVWHAGGSASLVDRSLEFYTNFYLQDDILMKVDRAAMMNSLETRAVFLDNDVVDFCARLPNRFKLRGGTRKYLLKKALDGIVPQNLLERRKKGFGVPVAKWLRSLPKSPPLHPFPGARMDRVAQMWSDHRAGKADHRMFLWSWLSIRSLPYADAAV